MSKKLKNEELKNVSGGIDDNHITHTCENPKCRKTFKLVDCVLIDDQLCCPHCKTPFMIAE